ncbi:tautomerase family protein [Pelagibius sp. Alg239-R121]|uniref:tautomerase family protein n=1 Tax=Pelagibius sp. Alg239-R121 TaxID=2993448 RepID=UPI0024A65FC3|nr:tautomerase family protein [Pelagibius sp. Alg239-R121]
MPFTKIHVPHSLEPATCRLISEMIHTSLVDTCAVNQDDNFCLISRYAAEDMLIHPTFLGNRDPSCTIIVEITLLAGRSDDQKEALYKDFRKRLEEIGFQPNNSIMFLTENNAVDWSFSNVGSVKTALGV